MAWFVTFDTATGALVETSAHDPGPPSAGRAVRAYDAPPDAGIAWSAAARDYAPGVAEGVPAGDLIFVLDPADPLGLPVDVQRATDPAPPAPRTTAPLLTQPQASFEWDGAGFAPAATSADRVVHGLLHDLLVEAQLHQWAADNAVARAAPGVVQDQLDALAARSWRKVLLTLKGQALLADGP